MGLGTIFWGRGTKSTWNRWGGFWSPHPRPRLSLQTPASDRVKETYTGEKSNKCKQCDYASSQAGDLRTHLKTHSGESKKDATNVTTHPLEQIILGLI